jgi:hypothetical protein
MLTFLETLHDNANINKDWKSISYTPYQNLSQCQLSETEAAYITV